MLYALTAPHSHSTYSLLSPLFFILSLWTAKTHRHECNMSLFFLLELAGPGQDNQSSVRHTVKGSHGRGWGSAERQRQRGCGKQNSSSMQQERDGAKTSQTTREKVRDLCERDGDLCEIAMDDECVSRQPNDRGDGSPALSFSYPCRAASNSPLGSLQADEEHKQARPAIEIIQDMCNCTKCRWFRLYVFVTLLHSDAF